MLNFVSIEHLNDGQGSAFALLFDKTSIFMDKCVNLYSLHFKLMIS